MPNYGLVAMSMHNALSCSSRPVTRAVNAVVRLHNCLFEVSSATSYCCRVTLASELVSVHSEKAVHTRDKVDHKLSLLKTRSCPPRRTETG